MKYPSALMTVGILLYSPGITAQPSYYESRARQTAEYKTLSSATERAYSVPGAAYNPPKSSSSGATSSYPAGNKATAAPVITNNNGYSNIGAGDKVARQNAAGERNEARAREQSQIIATNETKYRQLIAGMGNAKTDEDHYDLILVALRNGIDLRAAHNVVGKTLQQYKEKWGVHPDQPFLPSDGRVQYAMHSLKIINDPNYDGTDRAYHYGQIAKAYPTVDNYRRTGTACLVESQYQDAVDAFRQVLKLKEGDIEATAGMAAGFAFLNYLPSAEFFFKKIIDQVDDADMKINFAWVQMKQGKTGEALSAANEAASLDAIHPGYKLIQASLQTNGATAEGLANDASGLMPRLGKGNLVSRMISMIKFLHSEKAYQESLIYLDFALRIEPENLDLLELRYGTNLKIKRHADAQADEKMINSL